MAAHPGYEIPPHLYSPLKSTRTLIAKAIVGNLFIRNIDPDEPILKVEIENKIDNRSHF